MSELAAGLVSPFVFGHAWHEPVAGVQPAAGASFTFSEPSQFVSRLIACTFTLSTDGNAANRYVTVEHDAGQAPSYCADAAGVVVTANTTAQRFCGSSSRGVAEWATGTDVLFPLTPVFADAGHRISITVANIQVGDQLASIMLLFERFSSAPDVYGQGASRNTWRGWATGPEPPG